MNNKQYLLLAIGLTTFASSIFAVPMWTYIGGPSGYEQPSTTQCQQIKNGTAILVVGAINCTLTMPYAGFTNVVHGMKGYNPYFEKQGVSVTQAQIVAAIKKQEVPTSVDPAASAKAWIVGWQKTPYAQIKHVYVITPGDNLDSGYCGIPSIGGSQAWPHVYDKNNDTHPAAFPWT